MEKALRQKELGEFLRRHREQASPPAALRADPHRRAKGLRRSEVASRVGITEEWYTHLEQGRADAVSAQVLRGLTDTLRLSSVETQHIFTLAGKQLPDELHTESSAVPRALKRFLDTQSPSPGYIIDHHWDALAWNDGAQAILYDLASLPRKRRNVLVQILTNPAFREKLANWEAHARTVLAFFRRDYGQSPADPRIREVVAELEETSVEFRRWWPLQEVDDHVSVRTTYACPGGIRLEFDRLTMISAENPNLRIVVFQPVPNSGTEQHAARLVAEHRGRRAPNIGR